MPSSLCENSRKVYCVERIEAPESKVVEGTITAEGETLTLETDGKKWEMILPDGLAIPESAYETSIAVESYEIIDRTYDRHEVLRSEEWLLRVTRIACTLGSYLNCPQISETIQLNGFRGTVRWNPEEGHTQLLSSVALDGASSFYVLDAEQISASRPFHNLIVSCDMQYKVYQSESIDESFGVVEQCPMTVADFGVISIIDCERTQRCQSLEVLDTSEIQIDGELRVLQTESGAHFVLVQSTEELFYLENKGSLFPFVGSQIVVKGTLQRLQLHQGDGNIEQVQYIDKFDAELVVKTSRQIFDRFLVAQDTDGSLLLERKNALFADRFFLDFQFISGHREEPIPDLSETARVDDFFSTVPSSVRQIPRDNELTVIGFSQGFKAKPGETDAVGVDKNIVPLKMTTMIEGELVQVFPPSSCDDFPCMRFNIEEAAKPVVASFYSALNIARLGEGKLTGVTAADLAQYAPDVYIEKLIEDGAAEFVYVSGKVKGRDMTFLLFSSGRPLLENEWRVTNLADGETYIHTLAMLSGDPNQGDNFKYTSFSFGEEEMAFGYVYHAEVMTSQRSCNSLPIDVVCINNME